MRRKAQHEKTRNGTIISDLYKATEGDIGGLVVLSYRCKQRNIKEEPDRYKTNKKNLTSTEVKPLFRSTNVRFSSFLSDTLKPDRIDNYKSTEQTGTLHMN